MAGDHLEDPGINGRIILNCIFKRWDRGMDWINLAQDKDTWQARVNEVINIRIP
jgi:hypothetical protein